jgi:hypothetical protein
MACPDDPRANDDDEQRPGKRIIDVSSREPVIIEAGERAPFFAGGAELVRVFTSRGSARTCAIPVILILLLICCACVGLWVLVDNFF